MIKKEHNFRVSCNKAYRYETKKQKLLRVSSEIFTTIK